MCYILYNFDELISLDLRLAYARAGRQWMHCVCALVRIQKYVKG